MLGGHHDELIGHEFAHGQERLHGIVRLQVDQVRDMLALADGGGVRNLVDLEPIHAALVGEDQQVAVGGGHDQVLEEILGARAHADAALAAARLPAVGIDGRALEIAAVGRGDGHVLDGHQVFQADLAGVFNDLGAALVAIQLPDFLQLFDDSLAHQFLGAQQFQVLGDAALDFSQLVGDLLLLHAGEALQLQLDDSLRLALGELEGADQRIAGLAGGARGTDYPDHLVQIFQRFLESEQEVLGFQKALENLDEVIRIIRAARAPREARDSLIGAFQFTERQAQAIIELQLQRLTGMEQQKVADELAEIQRRIAEYLELLGSEKLVRERIVEELKEVRKSYGDERRTQIIEDTGEIRLEDLVAVEDVAVTVTHGGYLKRTSVDTYRRQSRGGKGRIGMGTRTEDFLEHLIVASTHSYLLIFTDKGRVYWLKIYEIPDAATVGKGKHVSNLINLQPDDTVKAFLAVREFVPDQFIVMSTKHGVIKKSELTEFDNPMARGIIAVSLDEGDELIAARLTNGKNYIFLGSHKGQAIRFAESQVRSMGRPARGVRGMDLEEGDYLVGMEIVEEEGLILSISENGFGKRTKLTDYG